MAYIATTHRINPYYGFPIHNLSFWQQKKKSIIFLEGIKKEKRNTLFMTRNGN